MQILQEDNILQIIPLIDRELLERDVQVAICSGAFTVAKDFFYKIQILNTLRRVCSQETNNIDFEKCLKSSGDKGMDFFISVSFPFHKFYS